MQSVAIVGLGYFSQFHLAAWHAHPAVQITAVVDQNIDRAKAAAATYGTRAFDTLDHMLDASDPDFIDLVVPPPAQAALIRAAAKPGRTVICQKPFCTSLNEAEQITAQAAQAKTTLVIHENFRFQPWYRASKRFLSTAQMGQIYSARFTLRPGDGRGPDAYLSRQPSFQTMKRFLVQETLVHQMDTFRYLLGPVTHVYAQLRQLNPSIAGEDAGLVLLTHKSGAVTTIDGNRLSDHLAHDPRRTMGEMVIEGEGGALSLSGEGDLSFRPFNSHDATPVPITEPLDLTQFGGGCVAALISHVVDATQGKVTLENTAAEYLDVLRLVEATYQSAQTDRRITL